MEPNSTQDVRIAHAAASKKGEIGYIYDGVEPWQLLRGPWVPLHISNAINRAQDYGCWRNPIVPRTYGLLMPIVHVQA